jgi:hypothetical protein
MEILSFRLGGETFRLSRAELERSVRHTAPKPIEKHFVVVSGRRYPPKQVISAATGRPAPVGKRRFDIHVNATENQLRCRFTLEEYLEEIDRARGTERDISLSQLRLVICENPYCYTPLPRAIFCGPYDERYGVDERSGDQITRIFAGEQILALETASGREKSRMERIIDESMRKRKATSEEG